MPKCVLFIDVAPTYRPLTTTPTEVGVTPDDRRANYGTFFAQLMSLAVSRLLVSPQRVKRELASLQYCHGLDVCSMRKHVHRLKRVNAIAVSADSLQFSGERLQITGYV